MRAVAAGCRARSRTCSAEDPELGLFAMTICRPRTIPLWKCGAPGRTGRAEFAASVGHDLALIHARSAADGAMRSFRSCRDLRRDPHRALSARDRSGPSCACGDSFEARTQTTLATTTALMHGDVSPKNILRSARAGLSRRGMRLLGDPAFDLAFCLNHLLSEGRARGVARDRSSYLELLQRSRAPIWRGSTGRTAAVSYVRFARLLPALFLARVDGKSPVEYLTRSASGRPLRFCAALWWPIAVRESRGYRERLGAPIMSEPVIERFMRGDLGLARPSDDRGRSRAFTMAPSAAGSPRRALRAGARGGRAPRRRAAARRPRRPRRSRRACARRSRRRSWGAIPSIRPGSTQDCRARSVAEPSAARRQCARPPFRSPRFTQRRQPAAPLWRYLLGDAAASFRFPKSRSLAAARTREEAPTFRTSWSLRRGEDFRRGAGNDRGGLSCRPGGSMAERGLLQGVADEGGWWPAFSIQRRSARYADARDRARRLLRRARTSPISLDIAASEFGSDGRYRLGLDKREFDRDGLAEYAARLVRALSDRVHRGPVCRGRSRGFRRFMAAVGDRVQVIGDDLLVTNARRVREAARAERRQRRSRQGQSGGDGQRGQEPACREGFRCGFGTIVSARSGETEDMSIVHLAIGWRAGQLKVGSFARSERMAKWNEVLRIEEALGAKALFAGVEAMRPGRRPEPPDAPYSNGGG